MVAKAINMLLDADPQTSVWAALGDLTSSAGLSIALTRMSRVADAVSKVSSRTPYLSAGYRYMTVFSKALRLSNSLPPDACLYLTRPSPGSSGAPAVSLIPPSP